MANVNETRGNHQDQNEIIGKIRETKEAFTQAASKISDAASSLYEKVDANVREQSEELKDTVTNYIRKKPFASMAGAMLIGATFAWIIKRRKRD